MKNKKLAVLALLPVFALTACGETGATAAQAHDFVAKSATIDVAKIIKNTHAVIDLNGLSAKGTAYTGDFLGELPVELNAGSQKVFDVTLKNYNGVFSNIQDHSLINTRGSGGRALRVLNDISEVFFEKWFTVDVFDGVTSIIAIVNSFAEGEPVIAESYTISGEELLTVKYAVPDLEALGKVVKKLYDYKVIDVEVLPLMGKGSASLEYTYGANGYLKSFNGAFDSDDIKVCGYDTATGLHGDTYYSGTLHGNISLTSDIVFYQDDEIATTYFFEQLLDEEGKVKSSATVPTNYTVRNFTKDEIIAVWNSWYPKDPLDNPENIMLLGTVKDNHARVLPGFGLSFVVDIPSAESPLFTDVVYLTPSSGVATQLDLMTLQKEKYMRQWQTKDTSGNVLEHYGFFLPEGIVNEFVEGDFELKFQFQELSKK